MNTLVAARGALGLAEVLVPVGVLDAVAGRRVDETARRVVQVLGARDMAQAVVTQARPSRPVLLGGAVVDSLHALSMVALAMVSREHRRLAGTSAAMAALMAAAQLRSAGRCVARSKTG